MNPYMIRKLAVHNQTDAHRIVCQPESRWATGRGPLLSLDGRENAAVLKIPEEQSVRNSSELPLRSQKRAANGMWKTCGNVRNVFYARSVFLLDRLTQMSHGRGSDWGFTAVHFYVAHPGPFWGVHVLQLD
jgi:hypothetical protein